jgi:hypothetical protein
MSAPGMLGGSEYETLSNSCGNVEGEQTLHQCGVAREKQATERCRHYDVITNERANSVKARTLAGTLRRLGTTA